MTHENRGAGRSTSIADTPHLEDVRHLAARLEQRSVWYEQPLDYSAGVRAMLGEVESLLRREQAARTAG